MTNSKYNRTALRSITCEHGRNPRNRSSPLNRRLDQRSVVHGEEPDDGDRRDLQGDLERLHGLQRSAAARALDDVRPVPVEHIEMVRNKMRC